MPKLTEQEISAELLSAGYSGLTTDVVPITLMLGYCAAVRLQPDAELLRLIRELPPRDLHTCAGRDEVIGIVEAWARNQAVHRRSHVEKEHGRRSTSDR